MAGHWFSRSQWRLPSETDYKQLQGILPALLKSYKELEQWCDQLLINVQYTHQRYFDVATSKWYTDIWVSPPVQYYEGKHPCEKPQQIMEQIIKVSSNDGDLVLDPFVGGGATGLAAINNDRRFVGCELDSNYYLSAKARLEKAITNSNAPKFN